MNTSATPLNSRPAAVVTSSHRRSWVITAVMAIVVLVPSLWGFGTKFAEFIALSRGDTDGVFAISPIVNYLLASLGFFCLFGWALLHGMFHDLEKPKETMLQTENMLDQYAEAKEQKHAAN